MPDPKPQVSIRITVVNPQGTPLGGKVDLEFQPRAAGNALRLMNQDASKEIEVAGLQRAAAYQLTVLPAGGGRGVSQAVSIPADGFATVTVVVDRQAPQPTHSLAGTLIFDHGLPAAGITVRLYSIGFAGKQSSFGEVKSDAQGKYSISYSPTKAAAANIQVRAVDPAGKEIPISATKFNAVGADTLNLVVPTSVRPLAAEFQRLTADLETTVGDLANLGKARESAGRQDLTLLTRSTNWDARVVALAATAVQQTATTGLGQDVLYGLYRVGLPTDPGLLATVPAATVEQALTKATKAGIVNFTDAQIKASTAAFQKFATKTLLDTTAAGAVSSFNDLLKTHFQDPNQLNAFANLYFGQPSAGSDLWTKAAKLQIPAPTLNNLRLQGKFLYLTFNNGALAQKLQNDIGSIDKLPQLADKDYHKPETWQNALNGLAGAGGDKALDALIPRAYAGQTTADRLAAYSGDLARRVMISFPTQSVARLVETKDIAIHPKAVGTIPKFLRAASNLGYSLGRTPLNKFLEKSGKNLPALDDTSTRSLKTLHRLYQVTPSTESLQAVHKLGFTSARDIASYSKSDFIDKFGYAFPPGEAGLVYGQAQTISSVTFNFYTMAKALDTSAPVYGLSSSPSDRQNAKDTLGQQFPSMASLFGNLDFCQCEDCRSVLSPAAYFVDLLDLLGKESAHNAAGNAPLDVLIGKDGGIKGRRPDLGALPLTCSNTNTAMPYIDLVNEILEYYIAHSNTLDGGAVYDTGTATTADLTAEPQHIIPAVYTATLKQALYPLDLPFDLWIETVRGFLKYFKTSLATVLDTLRPVDDLELFTSAPPAPYYRAGILAESLGISPTEYSVFTAADTPNWFKLYGSYANEAAALGELKNAKTLSQKLGVSYQGLVDLVKTGFLNPAIEPLLFQFARFGIDMGTAFSFTNQPGYPALNAQQTTDFQNLHAGITAAYKLANPGSTFDAKVWLSKVLPANYSKTVLVLADPNTGCNFSGTTLQYADGSPAKPLDFLKLNLFVRLCGKLGCSLNDDAPDNPSAPSWTLDEIDRSLQAVFPTKNLPAWANAGFAKAFGESWKTALVYLAHLDDLNARLAPALGRIVLLPFWGPLPVQGEYPLYSQLFLTASALNNDFAFDDPNGAFPAPSADLAANQRTLAAHATVIQGVLGLTADEITAILTDAGVAAPPVFSLDNLSICYRYSLLAQLLQLSVSDTIALKTLSGLNPFQALTGNPLKVLADNVLLNQTIAFVKQAGVAQNSGFTVEDLKYLLRHQFDPVGPYQSDPNALVALVQAVATGIGQIQSQNSVPVDPASMAESLIDQTLSGLFPAAILKTLFAQLTNARTYTATANSAAPLAPADFAEAPEVTLQYDAVTNTQTLACRGLLLDWRKAEIQALNPNAALNALLGGLLDGVQQQAQTALVNSFTDVLGVWASLTQYEAVATAVAPAQAIADPLGKLTQADPSLSFTYDPSDQLQWVGYRGALTTAKFSALTAINGSATLANLLATIQQQVLPAYNEMTGRLIAMWCNSATYKAAQGAVAPANQIDAPAFSTALTQAQQSGAIVDPVPPIQITYDSATQVQTLVCAGVLTDSMRGQLAALIAAPLGGQLLQSVRTKVVDEFKVLATGLLAPALNDPDAFVTPFLGAADVQQQKFAKAELIKVFLPLLVQKLSRQLVLQKLSSTLGANPALLEALVSDAALLNDPGNPGKSLLQAFLGVGQRGVSASYYDKNSALLASGIAATADTADLSNSVAGAVSCRFEGYLQVPNDGPYRFFAELGNTGAQATLRLDSPDQTALAPNPVIQAAAAKDGDEASQFVKLKGSVAYHFTLDFQSLGAAGARVLIQGENLPKAALSQIVLFSQQTVDAFARAQLLLFKVLRLLGVTGLKEREASYLVANASQFNNLKLSSLPTQSSDDSPAKAAALFSQFLTLADYADLGKGPAGGTDGLIDVFQAAATPSGIQASYYASANQTGAPQASGIAATADTTDQTNNKPGTASCRFEGYLLVPADGPYDFFAELGKAGAQVTFRLDAPHGIAALANPIVLQHTAAGDAEESQQAVTLKSGVAYHLTLDFQNLGGGNASLLVQSAILPKGPLSQIVLYPVSQLPPWIRLANLTRRDPQVVQDVAAALGGDAHFANNTGIRRMWDALQLVQILGLPVQAVRAATAIATPAPAAPDAIAATFKNAVKAQYTPEQWRPIAQSVFDPLRREKRDALVSYLVDALQLESSNQLFEYFLVDPLMEPIVQTSRLRLALSSIQTFIQRCFLNLESGHADAKLNVAASAIPAEWWPWMKRFRVWQANRAIFLFPENWMEPEFRLDKTDLFQALESALLQGDVTQDLAEDAFSDYLKGLDLRARLDIVATYLDQDRTNPGQSVLYVLGRTYTIPRQYFFRTYANGSWAGWEAVPVGIEGDHIVLAVWRGRLNLFWVTFIDGAQAPASGSGETGEVGQLPLDALLSSISGSKAQRQIKVQLHWSEYLQGKWTKGLSSDPNKVEVINVDDAFSSNRDVYIHVAKEIDANKNEGAVRILLDMNAYDSFFGFRVTSKNCAPAFGEEYGMFAPEVVYNVGSAVDATSYQGSQTLTASFQTNIAADGSGTVETENILQSVNLFEVLTCGNPVSPPFLPTDDPDYEEAGSLVSPFFFKDAGNPNFAGQNAFQDERTFFVQPSLTETVVWEWDGWAVPPYSPNPFVIDPSLIDHIKVIPQVPTTLVPINPGDPVYSVFPLQNLTDWVTGPGVAVSYGGVAIGKVGAVATQVGNSVAGAAGPGGLLAGVTNSRAGLTLIGRQGVTSIQLAGALKKGVVGAAKF